MVIISIIPKPQKRQVARFSSGSEWDSLQESLGRQSLSDRERGSQCRLTTCSAQTWLTWGNCLEGVYSVRGGGETVQMRPCPRGGQVTDILMEQGMWRNSEVECRGHGCSVPLGWQKQPKKKHSFVSDTFHFCCFEQQRSPLGVSCNYIFSNVER